MTDHSTFARHINEDSLNIGMPLTEKTVWALWQDFLYLNHWQMQGSIFQAAFPPDNTVGTGVSNNDDVYFFPIVWAPPRTDAADRKLGIRVIQYFESGASDIPLIILYDDFPTISSGTSIHAIPAWGIAYEAVYGNEALEHMPIECYDDSEWTPDAGGDFKALGVEVKELAIASISMFEMPTQTLSDSNARAEDRFFKAGSVIYGYDSRVDGGLGHLRHWLGQGEDDSDTVERNTRRCYFQTGHHTGIWTDSTASINLFQGHEANAEFTAKIKARNLLRATTGALKALPALVVSRPNGVDSTGSTITLTSARTADTWTYTFDGTEAVFQNADAGGAWATLIKPGDGGTSDLDVFDFSVDEYDEISFDVQCAEGKEIIIHTVSLWEEAAWYDVAPS